MTAPLALLRLLQTADSAFPTGAFAFSGGLETLSVEGTVRSAADFEMVLAEQIAPRWLAFDRVFLAAAHRAAPDIEALARVDDDCEAHQTVAPLAEASRRVGRATLGTHARMGTPGAAAYRALLGAGAPGHAPVVQGLVGAGLDLDLPATLAGAFHALLAGSASAAVRLGRLGAIAAQEILLRAGTRFAPDLAAPAPPAPEAFAPLIDIAAARRSGRAVSLFAT